MTYSIPRQGYYVIQSHQDGASFIGECTTLVEAMALADATQARADAAGHWCYQSVSYRECSYYRTYANPADRLLYELSTADAFGVQNAANRIYVDRIDAERAARRAIERDGTCAATVTRSLYNDARPTDRRPTDTTYSFRVDRRPR